MTVANSLQCYNTHEFETIMHEANKKTNWSNEAKSHRGNCVQWRNRAKLVQNYRL